MNEVEQQALGNQLRDRLIRMMEPGEELLWSDRPDQRRFVRRREPLEVVFGLFWLLVAMPFTGAATIPALRGEKGAMLWPILAITLIIWLPVILIAGAPVFRAREWRNTIYGVTSRRAIILSSAAARNADSIPLRAIRTARIEKSDERTGTLNFLPTKLEKVIWLVDEDEDEEEDADFEEDAFLIYRVQRRRDYVCFLFIPQPEEVIRIIADAQRKARGEGR